jgi:Tfp pilus assembly protein PilF
MSLSGSWSPRARTEQIEGDKTLAEVAFEAALQIGEKRGDLRLNLVLGGDCFGHG